MSAVTAVDFGFLYPETCGSGLRRRLFAKADAALVRVLGYPSGRR